MRRRTRAGLIGLLLSLPLLGLALLLAIPVLDIEWQHQPSHFWLVLLVAVANVVLGVMTSMVAERHGDARTFLVSLVLLTSAGFLGLHALATPGVLLEAPNVGFAIATPVGLTLAAALAGASALDLERDGRRPDTRLLRGLRIAVAVAVVGWGAASLTRVAGLDAAPEETAPVVIRVLAPVAVALYAAAAWRFARLYRQRDRILPLAVAVAFTLLAESMVAVVFGRSWHATWWEWHLLMAVAFGTILLATRAEYRRGHSVSEAFRGLYLDRTLDRIERGSSRGLHAFVDALEEGRPVAEVADGLQQQGVSADEVRALERSARELVRVDRLLKSYIGPQLATRLAERPGLATLGGREAEVSVLFADLAGFTAFSEGRGPNEVVEMLNAYWAAVVPVIVRDTRGLIERFAGDAVLAVFNALGDQPEHARNAARAAVGMRDAVAVLSTDHPHWPRFRIGVNTGLAVVGNVGTAEQHSFTAIGDTINTAARVQQAAHTGQILVSDATWSRINDRARAEPLDPVRAKGKAQPLQVHRLLQVW